MSNNLLLFCCAVLVTVDQAAAVDVVAAEGLSSLKAPYPVAGPQPGKYIEPKPEVAQSTTGYELPLPDFSALASLQFSDAAVASALTIIYASSFPAFLWLSATSRTQLMKGWYSAFNTGFMTFGVTLKWLIYLGLFPLLAVFTALVFSAVGYLGFRYPDPAFAICGPLWGSYLLTNLVHMLFVASASNMYLGLGRWIWLLLPLSLGPLGFYLRWETRNRRMAQNFITAFTSAFGAVAAVSVMLSYFCAHENSPFDLVSFITYPTGFRWSDPEDVGMLVLLVVLVGGGMGISIFRDRRQESPGFGEDEEGTLRLAKKLITGSYERVSRTFSSVSMDSAPFLSFAGSQSDTGTKRAMKGPRDWPDESSSHRGLKSLKDRNLLQKFERVEDYDTKDCSTDADSPVSLRSTLGDLSPTTACSVKVLQSTSKDFDEYDALFSVVTVADTEDFCSVF